MGHLQELSYNRYDTDLKSQFPEMSNLTFSTLPFKDNAYSSS